MFRPPCGWPGLRLLVKTIFPFTLPCVSAVVGDVRATELGALDAEASIFSVLVFVAKTNGRQINKSKCANLAWLN